MEKPIESSATSARLIQITPEVLRTIANRIESEAKTNTLPGQSVLYQLTKDITLVFVPYIASVPTATKQQLRGTGTWGVNDES